jgi:hypothetical protein
MDLIKGNFLILFRIKVNIGIVFIFLKLHTHLDNVLNMMGEELANLLLGG